MNVIGIESQPITTVGALERCRKVEKFFKTRSKEKASSNAEREGKDKGGERGEEKVQDDIVFEESLPLLLLDDAATVMPRQSNLTETVKEHHQTENTAIAVTVNKEETKRHGEESSSMDTTEIKHIESCASRSINELPRNGTTHTVESNKGESICDGTISNEETNIASNCHCDHSSTQQQPVPQLTESYTPIIHYLSNDDSVASIVGDALDTTQPIGLVGLHTCGDLACIVLRQFVQEPAIQSVCLVGCCYHHITEERDVTGSRSLYSVYVHFRCFINLSLSLSLSRIIFFYPFLLPLTFCIPSLSSISSFFLCLPSSLLHRGCPSRVSHVSVFKESLCFPWSQHSHVIVSV